MSRQKLLSRWSQKWGLALGIVVTAPIVLGLSVLLVAYAGRNHWDDLYDRLRNADARAMDAALHGALTAKGNEVRPFTLSEIVEYPLRDGCIVGGSWPPPDKSDRAAALVERSGRRWYWGGVKSEATVALELADGSARALRVRSPIELRFEHSAQRNICARPDRLVFARLSSDHRATVFLVHTK